MEWIVGLSVENHCFRTLQCHSLSYGLCCTYSHTEESKEELR